MSDQPDARLDHLILPVNDLDESISFYEEYLGFNRDGMHGPFTVMRVSARFVLLLAQFETAGGFHLAFSFSQNRFETTLGHIKEEGLPYGDRFDRPGNGLGPAPQPGAMGNELGIYITDPSDHLVEVRCAL